ncbi:DUF5627 domain-containing protein [Mongoliitalea daihaiensis]|uniref:DUF5627 domain-containing protein n=1 Tax=Mongoliitalea daihaiensis TaxID=2782006 RepID=UPI001F29445B|nr:DUF5627 domain-containing protein [Mongoliitalea daihaiensis]UJP65082.1 DUF1735 domain-containing protein [Mongoliitalea daihaiensis]
MKKIIIVLIAVIGISSCVNQDWQFPDFDFQSVYFAHQYPVRTITLGEDIFDTTLDNERKFRVMATTGGVYENRNDIRLEIAYDPSLVENLLFSQGGREVKVLPTEYFQMTESEIVIPRGSIIGGVEVQLTGAFFNDPEAIRNTYVFPLRIVSAANVDTVLRGSSPLPNPNRHVAGDWEALPKDFVLYAVKYVNEWHGIYLRRGLDVITGKPGHESLTEQVIRRERFVEQDELKDLHTQSLTTIDFPLTLQGNDGVSQVINLRLEFNNQGNCTISSATEGVTASGTGSFVKRGEKQSWGNQDRDALYLQYELDLPTMRVVTTDTLVMRNRGVGLEFFNPVVQ